jgi:hypothetical protein
LQVPKVTAPSVPLRKARRFIMSDLPKNVGPSKGVAAAYHIVAVFCATAKSAR